MGREAQQRSTTELATGHGSIHTHDGRQRVSVELRSLYQCAPSLVNAVKKLNLGVLPVECPVLCYKRAVNHDVARLSHAAVLVEETSIGNDGGDALNEDEQDTDSGEPRVKRQRRAVPTNRVAADDNGGGDVQGVVVGGLLTEYDVIHKLVHIQTLAVDAKFRRYGIGRQLVERVLMQASMLESATCVQLHVHVANDDAIAFYTAMGFTEHQRLEHYYRTLTPRTCIVLRRPTSETSSANALAIE